MVSFLSSEILPNLPSWFDPIFRANHRLCLPYALSIRDIDDILRSARPTNLIFHVDTPGQESERKHANSALELFSLIHSFVFHNAPIETVISFKDSNIWIYFDGQQRFSSLVGNKEIIQEAFRNEIDALKWHFVVQTDDMFLDEKTKIAIFDAITTI